MQEYKLVDLASVIRSKNSGPYELTFDVIFKDFDSYHMVRDNKVFTPELIAELYHIPVGDVMGVIYFDPAKAVKATIVRPMPSGNLGETDVYGAQQHAPLMNFSFKV